MSSSPRRSRELWDISPTVDSALQVWPGDTPPSREILLDMERGDNLTLSTWRTTVHCGAHVDAPSHYGKGAPTVDQWDLARFVGPCRVVSVKRPDDPSDSGWRIPARILDGVPLDCERILFATGSYPDPTHFEKSFDALSVELVERLVASDVRLVGIDTPSVDLFHSKRLPAHLACLRGGLAILEGLRLAEIPAGKYELIALPLKLAGFDASPVRAVLRSLPEER